MLSKILTNMTKTKRNLRFLTQRLGSCRNSSMGADFTKDIDVSAEKETHKGVAMPQEPTYCCMSGCANCVWIKYAQEVARLFDDGDVIAKNKILEKVSDPKLRTFLLTQLGLNDK